MIKNKLYYSLFLVLFSFKYSLTTELSSRAPTLSPVEGQSSKLSFRAQSRDWSKLRQHFDDDIFHYASAALSIIDADNGRLIFDYNGEKALIPASSLKVITTFSALDILGPNYTYKTSIYHSGEILDDGTLVGDVIIQGSGDPTLGSPFFEKASDLDKVLESVIADIKDAGITCIDGDILIDNTVFNDSPVNPTWQWNDLSNYYASGVWAFNIHENSYFVRFDRSSAEDDWTKINSVEPSIPNFQVSNKVKTGKMQSGDNAYIYSHPMKPEVEIKGTIPPGKGVFQIKGAIPRPDLFFIDKLKNALAMRGIAYFSRKDFPMPSRKKSLKKIGELQSPTLSEIVKYANLKSNNLYCEAILKTIANEITGFGSTGAGIVTILEHLKKKNIDSSGITFKDGSGLSARNRIPSNVLARFLNSVYEENEQNILKTHLPRAGIDEGLEYIFSQGLLRGKAYLKSGSMGEVVSFCGLVEVQNKNYIFSFISNGHKCGNGQMRQKFEQIMAELYSYQR